MKTLVFIMSILFSTSALAQTSAIDLSASSQPRNPVSEVGIAALAVGQDVCMGSSSIGAAGVSFGLSIGTTWTDLNCQMLKNARLLSELGYHDAAIHLMCHDHGIERAMKEAGTPCTSNLHSATTKPSS